MLWLLYYKSVNSACAGSVGCAWLVSLTGIPRNRKFVGALWLKMTFLPALVLSCDSLRRSFNVSSQLYDLQTSVGGIEDFPCASPVGAYFDSPKVPSVYARVDDILADGGNHEGDMWMPMFMCPTTGGVAGPRAEYLNEVVFVDCGCAYNHSATSFENFSRASSYSL